MVLFTLGIIALLVGVVIALFTTFGESRLLSMTSGGVLAFIALIMIIVSGAIYVKDNEGGIVVNKFGKDLPAGRIVAADGEKGPQAYVLPPGWHFWYAPWKYELNSVKNIDIPQGSVGVVTAVEDEEETNEDENSSSVSEASQEEITSTSEVTQGEIEEANMIPMIPSPEWLEKNGWEFVDFRIPRNGEIFINAHLKLSAENVNIGEQWGKRRWIIRPKMANQLAVEDKSIVEKTEEPAMPPVPDVQL